MKMNPITSIELTLLPIEKEYPWVQCSLWIYRKNNCAPYFWRSDDQLSHIGSQTRLNRIALLLQARKGEM